MRKHRKKDTKRSPYIQASMSGNRNVGKQMYTARRRHINVVGLLTASVIIAVVVFGGIYAYHQVFKIEEKVTYSELGDATLPQVAFLEAGYEVNTLFAYTQEMDILTMRDSISPLTAQGKLTVLFQPYENELTAMTYKIYSIDGTKLLKEETITEWSENQVTLDISNVIPDSDESLLQIELTLGDGTVAYYYTRLITYGNSNLSNNLEFVAAFHEAVLVQSVVSSEVVYETTGSTDVTDETLESGELDISAYLTSNSSTTDGTLEYVTQGSSESDVTWGDLEPTVISEVSWTITECSSLFVSVLLEYQVEALNSETEELETYNVEEFFRVGFSSTTSSVDLKQYTRTVNQVFEVNETIVADDGIDLGITTSDTQYKMNIDETAFAYVQERALYVYDGEENSIVEVFTLEDSIRCLSDNRYRNNDYDISILSIDENASVSFVVYGYMNRGDYQGQVGTIIYYYDGISNTLIEKAFVSTTTSFAVGKEDMSQGMYYSSAQNVLYLIAQNTFYQVNLTEDTQEKLAEDIDDSTYAISDDGKLIAYAVEDGCVILELETGDSYEIMATGTDQLMPFAFLEHDLIYGVYNTQDALLDETDSEMIPMYSLIISDEFGETLKTYESENQYIREVSIMDNMITLSLVEQVEDSYVYTGLDVITNNEATVAGNMDVDSYSTDQKQVQKVLTFSLETDAVEDGTTAHVIEAKMAYSNEKIAISYDSEQVEETYYAYAYGELQLQSTLASDAIKYASENTGAVVNEDLGYVWRSGSRDLTFTVSKYASYVSRMSAGESAIEIVSEAASQNVVFYTGCTTEQMCYIINQEKVIAAKLEDDSWVLLVGYTGSTMYYLNENGTKISVGMDTLDSEVIELVGDGLF